MKSTIISIIVAIVLIGGSVTLAVLDRQKNENIIENNVSIIDGKQIVDIRAKGGYQPRKSIAKAGIPTMVKFNTNGTFDCSSSVRIPSLDIDKVLPQSGETEIDIGINKVGILQGTCGMGMYPFEIEFKS